MVLDPQCQSYLPKAWRRLRGDQYFCSEHARVFILRSDPLNRKANNRAGVILEGKIDVAVPAARP